MRHADPGPPRAVPRVDASACSRRSSPSGGTVRGFVVPNAGGYSRSEVDGIVDQAKQLGAAGLVWARRAEDGAITSSIMKALGEDGVRQMLDAASARQRRAAARRGRRAGRDVEAAGPAPADPREDRTGCSTRTSTRSPGSWTFRLLEWDPGGEALRRDASPVHVAARRGHGASSTPSPGAARAKAYDLVLNGSEIGGGSIRIHDADACRAASSRCSTSAPRRRKLRFGFFLEALEYGTPPHGGIALGLDRIVAILASESSIREVIAFPKTADRGRPDVRRAVAGRREAAAGSCTCRSARVR